MSGVSPLTVLTVGDANRASTRYRVLALLPALESAGLRIRVRFPVASGAGAAGRALDIARDLFAVPGSGLLWIQRKTYPGWAARRLPRRGRRIVFDMDDAIDLPPPGRQASDEDRQRYRENFEATVESANLVLCGNRELASRLPHDRYQLLPTAIDTRRFAPGVLGQPIGPPALGWVGYSDNLRYLEALASPLRELARRHPRMRLIVVADRPPRLDGVTVEFRRWTLDSEVSCFRDIQVGLMPLEDTPWTRGKCAFKAIQYMALGIPTVASPVGMNADVIVHGDSGFLAADDAAWVEALDLLLSDANRASAVGDAGRRKVLADYSVEVVSRRLIELLAAVAS